MKKILVNRWPIFLIILLVAVFSWPFFSRGRVPFPSTYLVSFFPPWSASFGMSVKNNAMPDVITQIYPWKKLTVDSWKMGQIPLWNPYSFAGTPHAGNYQTAVFSPVIALFLFLKTIDAWSVSILLQPLLAGLFMFGFLRTVGASKTGSVLGSISFMFCGFIVVWMAYGTLAYAVLILPLILSSIVKFHTRPGALSTLGIALGTSFSLLSGHFQMSIYVIATSVIFAVFWGARAKRVRRTLLTLALVALGLTFAFPQLLASYDAYSQSVRMASFIKGEIIPWQYLVTVFSPDFYGNPVTRNDWFGHYAEWASFAGVVALFFAVWATVRVRRRIVWFFAGLGLGALLLATPTPLTDLLFSLRIPVLSTSAASRIIFLFSFSLAACSAFGIDALRRDWTTRKHKPFIGFVITTVLMVVLLWMAVFMGSFVPADKSAIAIRNSLLPTLVFFLGVTGALIGFWWHTGRLLILAAFILVGSFDSLRFAIKWMPFDPREYVYPKMDVIAYLTQKTGIDRVFGNFGNELGSSFGISSIEGYDALYQRRYGEFVRYADEGTLKNPDRSVVTLARGGAYAQRALDLLGVRFVLQRLSDGTNVWAYPYWKYPFYVSVYKDDHYEILENTHALPRYFLASGYEIAREKEDILKLLYFDNTIGEGKVVLEQTPSLEPAPGEGSVRLIRYTPNEIVFETDSAASKLLFLSDVHEQGWQASVDGTKTPVLRANYAFRAVALAPGAHEVRMIYRPRSVTIGLPISVFSLALLIMVSLRVRYEDRHL